MMLGPSGHCPFLGASKSSSFSSLSNFSIGATVIPASPYTLLIPLHSAQAVI